MVQFVKKGIFEILKPLKGRYREAYDRIAAEIDMTEYNRESVMSEGLVALIPKRKNENWLK